MSLLQTIPDISAFFYQPSFGLVEQAAGSGIDLFSIWKFCAIAVSTVEIIDSLAWIANYAFVNPDYTDDERVLGAVFHGIAILFQIPYINLSTKDDLYEFSNDGLAQFVITLDVIAIVITNVLALFGVTAAETNFLT